MARALIRSGNKRWYLRLPAQWRFEEQSERGRLVAIIRDSPGISTETLMLNASIPLRVLSRVPSRLAELERAGVLSSTFTGDLFNEAAK